MPYPPTIQSDMLSSFTSVRHGFFTNQGGVSTGAYATLNCSAYSNDVAENVAENRQRVADSLGLIADNLVSLRQIHSDSVYYVSDPGDFRVPLSGDGLVTDRAGIGLGVLGADCAPVLFADAMAGVVGAAHAGWKGALTGICDAVVKAMCERGAVRQNICAAIGPAMQADHYEVQQDFYEAVTNQSSVPAEAFFRRGLDRLTFDTPAYIEARLKALGLMQIDRSREDTFSQPDLFFSFRRCVQQGEADYGRQIAVISLV